MTKISISRRMRPDDEARLVEKAQTIHLWWYLDNGRRWLEWATALLATLTDSSELARCGAPSKQEDNIISLGHWIIRDQRSHEIMKYDHASSRAMQYACAFCRKGMGSWKKGLTDSARMRTLPTEHIDPCAKTWLIHTLGTYASESMPIDDRIIVARWLADHAKRFPEETERGRSYWNTPPLHWYDFLRSQPQPIYSEMAQHLEMGLILLTNAMRRDYE